MKLKLIILISCILLNLIASGLLFAQSQKTWKIGISLWTGYPDSVKGFKSAMSEEGLIEGKNVTFLYGSSGLSKEKQREIAYGFREAGVDLVYSLTTPGTLIVKEILPSTTPIVFSIVTYPADVGLIKSFEYSANNLVGTSNFIEFREYIKLLKTILPDTKSLAIFHRKGEPNSKIQTANIIRILKKEGIHVLDMEPESVEQMYRMAIDVAERTDVFMTTTDTLCQGGGERELIKVSLSKKIPILSSNKKGIEEGSTFGPVADFYVLGKMSGHMAAKIIINNVKPAQLETKIQEHPLVLVNRKSAQALSVEIPEDIIGNLKYIND